MKMHSVQLLVLNVSACIAVNIVNIEPVVCLLLKKIEIKTSRRFVVFYFDFY